MFTLLEALHPDPPDVMFVVEVGSEFADGLGPWIESLGYKLLNWADATGRTFDVILAAHASAALGELQGPKFCFPHGAGYNRLVPALTGSDRYATGIVDRQLKTESGIVIASKIGASHQEQVDRLGESCPEAAGRAVVIGCPVYDRIVASKPRRAEYRDCFEVLPGQKLVVVTSTWGQHGTVGREASLPKRLLAQLPSDEYRILLILHPNIWAGHSAAQIKSILREELDSGLVVIPPRARWEAGLIAADIVLGDHSSLSIYAASIGCRFLLTADGRVELVPESPLTRLCAEATRLDPRGDLRGQIEAHLMTPRKRSAEEVANTIFQEQGTSWAKFRREVRALAGLADLPEPPRMTPVEDPKPTTGRRVTAWTVSAKIGSTGAGKTVVRIERFPLIAQQQAKGPEDVWQVSAHAEVDRIIRQSSEIMVHSPVCGKADGEQWLLDMLTMPAVDGSGVAGFAGARNVGVAAYRHAGGCVVQWCDGLRAETDTEDAFAAAVVLHRLLVDGALPKSCESVDYGFRPGDTESFTFKLVSPQPGQDSH